VEIGEAFAAAALALLESTEFRSDEIVAIGSHGQTVLHRPDARPGSSMQMGDAAVIALPLPDGPFKPLLAALQRLQSAGTAQMRIRTALVTARSAPAHERAIRTLMSWNIEVDEAMFLGGLAKGEFLREFEPDFFFDDQTGHIESAARHVPAGHVASGVRN
jgi:5'-nucleotidase